LLGDNITNDAASIKLIIREIALIPLADSVVYDADNIHIQVINDDVEYAGLRFSFTAYLGKIRSRI